MHEMGIALEIVNIAVASVPKDLKNSKVKTINVRLGELSTVTPDNLSFCFDVVSRNTAIAGAKLFLEIIPVMIQCKTCNFESKIHEPIFKCRKCSSELVHVLSGRELDMCSIEIEEE